jgi:hypothetical protein
LVDAKGIDAHDEGMEGNQHPFSKAEQNARFALAWQR